MAHFLRKLFGRQQALRLGDEDTDLTKFYTNAEHAQQVFQQLIASSNLPKRILVVHGLGGVGKSTLLKMYGLTCRKHHIPVALVASEEALSPVDVLAEWEDDLNHDDMTLPTFQRTLNHYRAVQAKVEAEAKKTRQTGSQLASELGKTAAKTAIGMAASAIPIVGPLIGAVGGQSAEAFIDWLHGFLSKPDMELYLDPAKRLNSDFLNDLAHIAARQRIVLMIDTYEQMTALDEWMRELARQLPRNVLLVIASRLVPTWDRSWQGWMGKAEVVELQEMAPDDLRTLVQRYYAYIRGGNPDPKQVEAIVRFARGLPMVATTVVQLWVKYGAEDFQTVRPQVVADLADRLLERVSPEMRPAFEAAAILRYFNVDILAALLDGGDAEALYTELRRWPFIRSRREGLAVHTTMREMINEALHVRTPERSRTLHERAAAYYEAQLEKSTSDERERYTAEWLYHRVKSDENTGIRLFQERAEELTRYHMANQLRALMNDANTYPLEQEHSRLWREYYNARLAHLGGQFLRAEEIYRTIGENEGVEPKLRAYALCDWGAILCRRERLRQLGVEKQAIRVLELSLPSEGSTDVKLAMTWVYLSDIYIAKGNWGKALSYLEPPKRMFSERRDYSGLMTVLEFERRIYWRQGNLRKTFDMDKQLWETYKAAGEPSYLRIRVPPEWEWAWDGRYAEREKELRVSIEIIRSLQDQESLCVKTRDLALCVGSQGKCAEAEYLIEQGLFLAQSLDNVGKIQVFVALGMNGVICFKCGRFEKAEEYLTQAMMVGQELHIHVDAVPLYLAMLYVVLKRFDKAEYFYEYSLTEAQQIGRTFYKCGALTGLTNFRYIQNDYTAIPPLWTEAQQLAQHHEYNDYLTSLNLTRGHITWDSLIPEWESGFDSALHYYQYALIHALRFNRFLLDEVLSGREQETPLRSIIPHCLERRGEGQLMLVALRNWWQTGVNAIGVPRPDTISPIPEGISLLEAERIVRQREPGDGSLQKDVVEQINVALAAAPHKDDSG